MPAALEPSSEDRGQDLMALLPRAVLLTGIAPLLSPLSLLRLGCCSRALQASVLTDEIWMPLCAGRKWGPFARGMSWLAGYSQRQRQLCSECGLATKYIFTLFGPHYRLCDQCEFKSLKYAIITGCEATEHYGLLPQQLTTLPSIMTCGTRFYLKSHVVAVLQNRPFNAAASTAEVGAASAASPSSVSQQAAGDGSDSEAHGSDAEHDKPFDMDSEDEEFGGRSKDGGLTGSAKAAAAAERKAAEKAARKANKKVAKESQRSKRESKATAPTAGAVYASLVSVGPPLPSPQSSITAAAPAGAQLSGAFARSTAAGGSGAGRAGHAQLHADADDSNDDHRRGGDRGGGHGSRGRGGFVGGGRGGGGGGDMYQRDGKKLRHREQQAAAALRIAAAAVPRAVRRGGRAGGGGPGSLKEEGLVLPMEGLLGSSPKTKSSWMVERERLMDEFGAFGLSGLIMATD